VIDALSQRLPPTLAEQTLRHLVGNAQEVELLSLKIVREGLSG
jgi:hypothetical protein